MSMAQDWTMRKVSKMERNKNLFFLWADIVLWQVNSCHRDVFAESVFQKMGGLSMLPIVDDPSEPPSANTQAEDAEVLIGCLSV